MHELINTIKKKVRLFLPFLLYPSLMKTSQAHMCNWDTLSARDSDILLGTSLSLSLKSSLKQTLSGKLYFAEQNRAEGPVVEGSDRREGGNVSGGQDRGVAPVTAVT